MTATVVETFELAQGPTQVQWRRSARARRISLRIDPRNSYVIVTLPMRAGRAAGMTLLANHAAWVADRLAALPRPISFADGASVPIAGAPHRIRHMPGERGGAWLAGGEICVAGEAAFLPRRVADLLRREARQRLGALAAAKAEMARVRPSRVTVKDTSSRWGSCAPDGTVMFSWRLVMAPVFVQDYVAAHEVAHLRHMNHGKRFWALVSELTPHADAGIAWLRREGAGLLRTG